MVRRRIKINKNVSKALRNLHDLFDSFMPAKELLSKEILSKYLLPKKPLYAYLRQALNVLLCTSVHVSSPVMLQYMLDHCKISRIFQDFKNVHINIPLPSYAIG